MEASDLWLGIVVHLDDSVDNSFNWLSLFPKAPTFSCRINVVSLWLSSSAYGSISFSGLLDVDNHTGTTVDVYMLFISCTTLLDVASFGTSVICLHSVLFLDLAFSEPFTHSLCSFLHCSFPLFRLSRSSCKHVGVFPYISRK